MAGISCVAESPGIMQFRRRHNVHLREVLRLGRPLAFLLAPFLVVPGYKVMQRELITIGLVFSSFTVACIFFLRYLIFGWVGPPRQALVISYVRKRLRWVFWTLPIALVLSSILLYLGYRSCLADSIKVKQALVIAGKYRDVSDTAARLLARLVSNVGRAEKASAANQFIVAWGASVDPDDDTVLAAAGQPIPFSAQLLVYYVLFLSTLQAGLGILSMHEFLDSVGCHPQESPPNRGVCHRISVSEHGFEELQEDRVDAPR